MATNNKRVQLQQVMHDYFSHLKKFQSSKDANVPESHEGCVRVKLDRVKTTHSIAQGVILETSLVPPHPTVGLHHKSTSRQKITHTENSRVNPTKSNIDPDFRWMKKHVFIARKANLNTNITILPTVKLRI